MRVWLEIFLRSMNLFDKDDFSNYMSSNYMISTAYANQLSKMFFAIKLFGMCLPFVKRYFQLHQWNVFAFRAQITQIFLFSGLLIWERSKVTIWELFYIMFIKFVKLVEVWSLNLNFYEALKVHHRKFNYSNLAHLVSVSQLNPPQRAPAWRSGQKKLLPTEKNYIFHLPSEYYMLWLTLVVILNNWYAPVNWAPQLKRFGRSFS